MRPAAPAPRAAPYGIERHHHLFAAWAAGRAASVKGCRFTVASGRAVLEAAGFTPDFCRPDQLPAPAETDERHRAWRAAAIAAAGARGLSFTHGVAAKLINVYLKGRFVCGGHHAHERVAHLHPPIDDGLLAALAAADAGGFAARWRRLRRRRWSTFGSEQYEEAIDLVRRSLGGAPLWAVEEHWKGNQ